MANKINDLRMRIHGDPLFLTPEEDRVVMQRDSILMRHQSVKPTTYRKFFGRHEHRVIGEKIAGRHLRTDEHVHHIDGNKQNNDPSNLKIMTAKDHLKLHAALRRAA